jgi:hypothetical protein
VTGLLSQYSLGQDQYPKTVIDANNVLSNHWFDPAYVEAKKKRCQQPPHSKPREQEQDEDKPELLFAQMEGRCYCCSKTGHKSPQCRYKDRPKHEWAINKTPEIVHAQTIITESTSARDDTSTIASSSTTQLPNNSKKPVFSWQGAMIAGVSEKLDLTGQSVVGGSVL